MISMWAAVMSIVAAAAAFSGPQQAHEDAAALLARVHVPPGSQQYSGAGGPSAPPYHPDTPNLADVSRAWIVSGSRDDVLGWIAAHRPAGSTLTARGTGSSSGLAFEGFQWPVTSAEIGRLVLVEAVQRSDGRTALRADGLSAWVVRRSAAERIPPRARVLRATVTLQDRPVRPPLVVRDHRRIRRVASLLDSLPLFQPGVAACPNDPGYRVSLAFRRTARGAISALAIANPGGSADVQFELHGRHEPALVATSGFFPALYRVLGITPIPRGPAPRAP